MTFEQAVIEAKKHFEEIHKDDNRIFYPDPCNEDDCVQCGKHIEQHSRGLDNELFFCKTSTERESTFILHQKASEILVTTALSEKEAEILKMREAVCSFLNRRELGYDDEGTLLVEEANLIPGINFKWQLKQEEGKV